MNEERIAILKMLAEGKIKVEEADMLLQALEGTGPKRTSEEKGRSGFFGMGSMDFDFSQFADFEDIFKNKFADFFCKATAHCSSERAKN